MPKEKSINPVTAHAKSQKAKQIRKNKSTVAAQRTEKLARRNPERLARQIEQLEEASQNGQLKESEKKRLEDMKRDLGRVKRAREKMGVPENEKRRWGDGEERGVLGKRGRDGERKGNQREEEESSDTDEDVKDIPMPLDVENMPPVPRKRHNTRGRQQRNETEPDQPAPSVPIQTVYESKPQIRNLVQESTRFVPSSVRTTKTSTAAVNPQSGGGALLEPEELDEIEAERERQRERLQRQRLDDDAKVAVEHIADEAEKEVEFRLMAVEAELGAAKTLEEEEKRFKQEVRNVEIEEVEDEDL